LRRENAAALGETTLAAVLWGTSFPIVSLGIKSGLDPELFVLLRFATAAPMMIVAAKLFGKTLMSTLRLKPVWVLALLNAVGFLSQFIGQSMTDASVAALLVNLSVLVTAVGSVVVLKEKFGRLKSVGVVLALVGIILLTTKGDLALVTRGQLTGDVLYLLAAFVWGWYMIYNKQRTDKERWDPIAVSACIVLLTALFLSPLILLTANGARIPLSGASWAVILYTAIFNTAVPFTLYQRGLRFLTATSSAIVLMLEIVTAVVISTLFLQEMMNVFSLLGAISVLLSIFLVSGVEVRGKNLSVPKMSG
jgi:drug/metabolite transporter (DMT)-like permease